MASSGRPAGRVQVTLLPENTQDCEKDQLWLNSQELQMVREALETNQGRLTLRWALEPMTGTATKEQFLMKKNAKMPDPSDEEDEDEDDDNLGRVSPTRSNLSGLSSGKMMSSRMLKSAVKPTSPYKDDKFSKAPLSKKSKKPRKSEGAKPEKGSKNAALRERGEGSGSESNDDEADKDDHSPKGYGQVKKNKTPKDADKRTKDDSGDENPKGKKAMKGNKDAWSSGEMHVESDKESNSPPAT